MWTGSVLQILLLANFLIPLTYRVKEGMTRDSPPLFFMAAEMGERFITPRNWLCSVHGSLGDTENSASARVRTCQDGAFVSEVKASPCPISSLCSPWKTSQALRTLCRTNRGGMAEAGLSGFVFLLRLGLG